MSLRYLLDTDICIYLIKGKPATLVERLALLKTGEGGISVVTYGELRHGAEKSRQRERNLHALELLAELLPVHPLPMEAGEHYGRIRTALEQAGTPIGNNDLWIAAHACCRQLTLVSNNAREFIRVEDLRLENWLTPDGR